MDAPRALLVLVAALGAALGALAAAGRPALAEHYALRDGDTVVFLGDSFIAARTYGKIVENHTILRFPERKVRFFNAAIGGDTAEEGARPPLLGLRASARVLSRQGGSGCRFLAITREVDADEP